MGRDDCCVAFIFYIEMNHSDVYANFNVELVQQLKMKDPIFVAMLTKQRLFFGELKAKVREQSTEAEASSLFLQEAIEPSLESNDPEPFMKLLSAMNQFGGPLEKLSTEMNKCLKSTMKCIKSTTSTTDELQSTDTLGKNLYIDQYISTSLCICTICNQVHNNQMCECKLHIFWLISLVMNVVRISLL